MEDMHSTDERMFGKLGELYYPIRERIYCHLLHGRSSTVRVTPPRDASLWQAQSYREYYGRARSYQFQTQVLRLNKAFYHETKYYLCCENAFVVVDHYRTAFFAELIHKFDVPVVYSNDLGWGGGSRGWPIYPAWSVYLDIQWHPSVMSYIALGENHVPEEPKENPPTLMLVQDLPKLLKALRFASAYISPPCTSIVARTPQLLRLGFGGNPASRCPYLGVTVRNESTGSGFIPLYRRLTEKQEKKLARRVQRLTGFGYKSRHMPMGSNRLWTDMRVQMSPSLIWMSANEFDMIRSAMQWKKAVDDYYVREDTAAAYHRVKYLAKYMKRMSRGMFKDSHLDSDRVLLKTKFEYLFVDILLTKADLALRVRMEDTGWDDETTIVAIEGAADDLMDIPQRLRTANIPIMIEHLDLLGKAKDLVLSLRHRLRDTDQMHITSFQEKMDNLNNQLDELRYIPNWTSYAPAVTACNAVQTLIANVRQVLIHELFGQLYSLLTNFIVRYCSCASGRANSMRDTDTCGG
jgi:hypothetical protein